MVELSPARYTLRITKMGLLNYRGAYILIPSPVTEGGEGGGKEAPLMTEKGLL